MKLSASHSAESSEELSAGIFGATDPFRFLALHLLDTSDDALMLLEPDGQIVTVNSAWTVLTGRSRLQLAGQTVYSLADTLDTDALIDWLAGAFSAAENGLLGRTKFRHVNGFELDTEIGMEAIAGHRRETILWLIRMRPVRGDGYRSNRRRTTFRRVE